MVKKFWPLSFLLLLLLAAPDDYYSRVERLLSGLNTIELQANSLPVLTGALDEAQKYPKDNYYKNIIVLADTKENRSWRTYENSRRLSRTYAAVQFAEQIFSRATVGQRRYFYNDTSGVKYQKEDMRQSRERFFLNYNEQTKGADGYMRNILIPADQYLADTLTLELPELPDPGAADFQLPEIQIAPLDKKELSPGKPREFQWHLQLAPVYGVKQYLDPQTIIPEYEFGVGLKIISPDGLPISSREQLEYLQPLITIVPLPEHSEQQVYFKTLPQQAAADKLEFAAEIKQAATGRPLLIPYYLPENIQVVEFTVSDKLGRPFYVKKESAPDPRNPLPFSWLPDKQAGEYYAVLKGYDIKNQTVSTVPKPLRLSGRFAKQPEYRLVPHKPSGEYYSIMDFRSVPIKQGLHKIYFWLYGTEDSSGRPIAASLYISLKVQK